MRRKLRVLPACADLGRESFVGAIPPSSQLSLAETAGRKAGEGDSTGNDELFLLPVVARQPLRSSTNS